MFVRMGETSAAREPAAGALQWLQINTDFFSLFDVGNKYAHSLSGHIVDTY
jgi:hypothetical protein